MTWHRSDDTCPRCGAALVLIVQAESEGLEHRSVVSCTDRACARQWLYERKLTLVSRQTLELRENRRVRRASCAGAPGSVVTAG